MEPTSLAGGTASRGASPARRLKAKACALLLTGFLPFAAGCAASRQQGEPTPPRPEGASVAAAAATAEPTAAPATNSAATPHEIPNSGDVQLDALRRLAVNAPIAELVESRLLFTYRQMTDYRTDPYLWQGMSRLADAVLSDPTFPARRQGTLLVTQVVEASEPGLRELVGDRVPALKQLAERLAAEQGKPSASTSVRIKL